MGNPLITSQELAEHLTAGDDVCVLDVRWRLDRPEGRPAYLNGHIPTALYVDLERDLAERGDPSAGRHPAPSVEIVQRTVEHFGIRQDVPVVIYDDLQSVAAARAWWVLTRSGHPHVRVLDGGLKGWLASGGELSTGDNQARYPAAFTAAPILDLATIEEVARVAEDGLLIDVRHKRLYRGDDDPHDPIAGHIPRARNLPTTAHLSGEHFVDAAQIRANFDVVGARGTTEIIAYCGSGVASAHTVLAGEIAGVPITLYPGSWSEWSRSRGRRYAVGASPAGFTLPV